MVNLLTEDQLVRAIADVGKHYFSLLFGAGASRSSGVLLAREIVHDLCLSTYCDEFRIDKDSREKVPATEVRQWVEIQEWYAEAKEKGESDYSAVFRRFKPTQDHQIGYIKGLLTNAKPSAAYRGLAHLVHEGYCQLLLTTNFEPLFEHCYHSEFPAETSLQALSTSFSHGSVLATLPEWLPSSWDTVPRFSTTPDAGRWSITPSSGRRDGSSDRRPEVFSNRSVAQAGIFNKELT